MPVLPTPARPRTRRHRALRTGSTVTAAAVLAALVASCGDAPAPDAGATPAGSAAASSAPAGTATGSASAAPSAGGTYKACMVLDVGGVDDRSFNQSAWAGMTAAKAADPTIDASYVSSASGNDYIPNLTNETRQGCKTTVAVGGLMTDAVTSVAKANANANFAIIDSKIDAPNVYSLEFNTAQGGFLGGYLAAGMSKTGKVGTFGGLKIPPVTVYMDGYWEGVQYYNKQKGKNVAVLGWDETTQNGTFSQSFTDQSAGTTAARTLQQQGADIVFPVAGGSGLGAGAAAQSSGGKLNLIWVDTDGCVSAAQYCKFFVSTVFKDISGAVQAYLKDAVAGKRTGSFIGTVANKGTGLSPFHEFDSKVPQELKDELTKLQADLASGAVPVTSKAQPTS